MKLQVLWNVATHPSNAAYRVPAVCRALGWQLRRLVVRRPLDITVFDGVRFRCYPDSRAAHTALSHRHGLSDFHEMNFLRDYLRPGDNFLDLGANVGLYTLLASKLVLPGGRIDSVEPDAKTAQRLRTNIELNSLSHVHVHECAVGTSNGFVRFTSSSEDLTNHIPYADESASDVREVPSHRLDDLLGNVSYAAAKADLEGAEPLALQGAEKMLAASNPAVWLIEVNGRLRGYGWTEERLAGYLRERGYDLALYDASHRELRFDDSPWLKRDNALAIARERRDVVLDRLASPQG